MVLALPESLAGVRMSLLMKFKSAISSWHFNCASTSNPFTSLPIVSACVRSPPVSVMPARTVFTPMAVSSAQIGDDGIDCRDVRVGGVTARHIGDNRLEHVDAIGKLHLHLLMHQHRTAPGGLSRNGMSVRRHNGRDGRLCAHETSSKFDERRLNVTPK